MDVESTERGIVETCAPNPVLSAVFVDECVICVFWALKAALVITIVVG